MQRTIEEILLKYDELNEKYNYRTPHNALVVIVAEELDIRPSDVREALDSDESMEE